MELESYEDGTLLYIGIEAGQSVPVDGVIAIIGEPDADYKALLAAGSQAETPAQPATQETAATKSAASPETKTTASADSRLKASPLAKKLAKEKGLDITKVSGSGENGRVVKKDIENYKESVAASQSASDQVQTSSVPGKESFEEVQVTQMRKTIAKRLSESLYTAPHFYLTMEINMDKAIEARKGINEYLESKISFNDFVIKAVAMSLRQHPKVNASWLGDKIRYNHHIHIGMAVAVEEGLLVPVIRFADTKSLSQISNEAKTLGNKAKNKQLQPTDWEGNTFTISNLGMFGIEEFTAIINPPDACILAVGGIKETVVVKNGEMKVGNVMKVTLSCDHRVVDGAVGAAFLQTLKSLLEDPVRMLA
jgi:pyruvate dehydrogenase E2 component (dihydrolipoamide acetyltransferase)